MASVLNAGIILRAKRASSDIRQALARLQLAMKAYDPDQPRAPGGTEEGGQWIAVDGPLDLIQLAGAFDKNDETQVRDFIARMCRGSIQRVFPGGFLDDKIGDVVKAAKLGDADARTCLKLLSRPEYRK